MEPLERMTNYYNKLVKEGKISKDRRLPINPPIHTDILVEQLFYAYMELLIEENK